MRATIAKGKLYLILIFLLALLPILSTAYAREPEAIPAE